MTNNISIAAEDELLNTIRRIDAILGVLVDVCDRNPDLTLQQTRLAMRAVLLTRLNPIEATMKNLAEDSKAYKSVVSRSIRGFAEGVRGLSRPAVNMLRLDTHPTDSRIKLISLSPVGAVKMRTLVSEVSRILREDCPETRSFVYVKSRSHSD